MISKRQLVRLLNRGQDAFLAEAREVLRAGLATAGWVSVDDTGARHRHRNGVCTQLGNDHFAAFATTGSKSRLNFLEVLRAGYADYVVNAEALAYMRRRSLAGRSRDRQPGEAPRAALSRRGGLAPASRTARHHRAGGRARSGADRHGRGGLGQRQGAWAAARHGDPLRRRRPVRARRACALLGPCRAVGAQARHLHRPAARGTAVRARPDLVVLRRPESLPVGAGSAATVRAAGAVRPDLPPPHRVRGARPPAAPAARAQGRALARPGSPRDTPAHQWLGARPAPAGDQAQDLRRHTFGAGPHLPRRVPRPAANLRQAGGVVLGLSRPPPRRARDHGALPARSRQAALSPRLSARPFAPRTLSGHKLLKKFENIGGAWVPIGTDRDPPTVRNCVVHQRLGRKSVWVPLRRRSTLW